ncbi:glycosyltransferase family protein [Nocardioides aequoreus]|uniref:glycosyltransferase family protein n=1 Tax=Nocardioides aequoreus TaxID=397278 RepID=UPI0012F66492|nr:glycosyltransferase [Nocardioides aequoreus]
MSALQAAPPVPRRRVALYSHDTQGLGHVRRNIEIARALLAERPDTDVLLLSGAPEAARLPRPEQAGLVVLPSVSKSRSGEYAATQPGLGLAEVLRLRGAMVASAIEHFRPDVLVVDKEARGLRGELDPALAVARRTTGAGGRRTRLVLGLRDVLDTPLTARREWESAGTTRTLRSSYDAVWVYGDPRVHDLGDACGLPRDVRAMMRFTGYLAEGRHHGPRATYADGAPYVLCLVGGGQDGADLADAFVRAPLPRGHRGVVVTGPYMPRAARDALDVLAGTRDDLSVLGFVDDTPGLIDGAAAVVTMGGYNTVCELLASGRPGLVVPRVVPRLEQAVRADELARRTHLDALHPDEASADAVGAWLADAVGRDGGAHDLDLGGLTRLPALLDQLLEEIDDATA